MRVRARKSDMSASSSVRRSEARRSEQNLQEEVDQCPSHDKYTHVTDTVKPVLSRHLRQAQKMAAQGR